MKCLYIRQFLQSNILRPAQSLRMARNKKTLFYGKSIDKLFSQQVGMWNYFNLGVQIAILGSMLNIKVHSFVGAQVYDHDDDSMFCKQFPSFCVNLCI